MFRCKNMEVQVDKIYNKSQRDKFAWAIDMTEADFVFWPQTCKTPVSLTDKMPLRNHSLYNTYSTLILHLEYVQIV